MSLTRTVPAAVPSLFHSSRPWPPAMDVKYSVPLTFTRLLGEALAEESGPGLMSFTRCAAGANRSSRPSSRGFAVRRRPRDGLLLRGPNNIRTAVCQWRFMEKAPGEGASEFEGGRPKGPETDPRRAAAPPEPDSAAGRPARRRFLPRPSAPWTLPPDRPS